MLRQPYIWAAETGAGRTIVPERYWLNYKGRIAEIGGARAPEDWNGESLVRQLDDPAARARPGGKPVLRA